MQEIWRRAHPRICLVHDWLTGMRGGEKCLELLCQRWPDADLFTLLHAQGSTSHSIESMRIHTSPLQRLPGIRRYYRYCLPVMPWAMRRLRVSADADLVISLSHAVAKGIDNPHGVPHVCYCFTPMRYAWHLRADYLRPHPHQPERMPSGHWGRPRTWWRSGQESILARLRQWDQRTSRSVTHFVAISRTVANRIQECYGRESQVIFPPVNVEYYTPSHQPREDFYLCVSALVPYKRIELAVEACRRSGRRLIVIGTGPETRRLRRRASSEIQFLGWQPDDVIRDHLRRCRALLFPGHEDFGIVPVEAQACGTAVIAFRRGGATETVIEPTKETPGTGFFFEEQTADSLATAMERFEQFHAWFDPQLARANAERFSQARFVQELSGYVEQILSGEEEAPARRAA